jgi:hypothetical protein
MAKQKMYMGQVAFYSFMKSQANMKAVDDHCLWPRKWWTSEMVMAMYLCQKQYGSYQQTLFG